jgi:hypothetical protein
VTVRSSSRRIQPASSTTELNPSQTHGSQFNRRDIHLLRHMIFMITVFVGGWAPLYTLLAIQDQFTIDPVLSSSFTILCQAALLCDIIDLYLYNHELRAYFKDLLKCVR